MSNARLYEVTSTVIRHGYTRAYVNVHHVAAATRQRAIKDVRDRLYVKDADAVTVTAVCLGSQHRITQRVLQEIVR